MENSRIIEQIKKLNLELENFEEDSEFYEDAIEEDDVGAAVDEEVFELLQEEIDSSEKDAWLLREDSLREQLV